MGYFWEFLTNIDNYEWVIRKVFDSVDIDKSGEIGAEDIISAINSLNSYYDTGFQPTLEHLQHAIALFDLDKSGKICFNEFMGILRKLSKHEFPIEA